MMSGLKIVMCWASARSIDRSCLPCFVLQYITQVWLVFLCPGRTASGYGWFEGSASLSITAARWPVCHIICLLLLLGQWPAFRIIFGGAPEFILFGRKDFCPSVS